MWPSDVLRLAWQGARGRRLRLALTVLAIVIGVALVGTMLALTSGLRRLFVSQFMAGGELRQVVVTRTAGLGYAEALYSSNTDAGTKLTDELLDRVRQVPGVAKVTPVVIPYVFDSLVVAGKTLPVPVIRAYEPSGTIWHQVVAGRDLRASDGPGVLVVTPHVADQMGFHGHYGSLVGRTVTLRTHSGYSGYGSALPPPGSVGAAAIPASAGLEASVVGVAESADSDMAMFVPLSWGRQLLTSSHWGADGGRVYTSELDRSGYQSLVVLALSPQEAEPVAARIRGLGVGAVTAASYVQRQVAVINVAGYILGGIGLVALVVAGIGIINTMNMAILERTKEIGIMRAVGATRADIRRQYITEAALYGVLGGLVGLGLTYGLCMALNILVDQQLAGNSILSRGIVQLEPAQAALVWAGTIVLSILAGLYPALAAARLRPAEAIRLE